MTILADSEIRELCHRERPMISPYSPTQVRKNEFGEKILSWGQSSFGYDIRIAPEFRIFSNINTTIVDPKEFDQRSFVEHKGDSCIIPPNSFVLTRSVERLIIPDDVIVLVLSKSTVARVGVHCLATPLEPGWEGYVTLEYANSTPLPAKIYANEGGAQLLFFRGNIPAEVTYAMRNGKYQNQAAEIVLPMA